MKTFNSIEEMKPYYNEKTNTYEFVEEGIRFDIKLTFDLKVSANITVGNIDAVDIIARNINAENINAWNIISWGIDAWNINSWGIKAGNINAWNIKAFDIDAKKISYHAVCYAYRNIVCEEIKSERENAKHFVLEGTITIKGESK